MTDAKIDEAEKRFRDNKYRHPEMGYDSQFVDDMCVLADAYLALRDKPQPLAANREIASLVETFRAHANKYDGSTGPTLRWAADRLDAAIQQVERWREAEELDESGRGFSEGNGESQS